MLEMALDKITLRERFDHLRAVAPRLALVALAAMVSYLIARYLIGHPQPFFAPISAVLVMGVTAGRTVKRALQLAFGVALGIAVADLLVRYTGVGAWQLGLVIFVVMCVVVFAGGDQLAVNQAAASGVLVAILAVPTDPHGFSRLLDILVGAGTALLFTLVLFPLNPSRLAKEALNPALEQISIALRRIADALESGSSTQADSAVDAARELEHDVEPLRAAAAVSDETSRLAVARRGQLGTVDRYAYAVEQVTRVQVSVVSLARGASAALRQGNTVPPTVIVGLRDLAEAADHVAASVTDKNESDIARVAALRAATASSAALDHTRNLAVSIVVGQVRMIANDLLRATGMSLEEARHALHTKPGGDDDAVIPLEPHSHHPVGLHDEIEAARPRGDS